jgi:hypothetical protein
MHMCFFVQTHGRHMIKKAMRRNVVSGQSLQRQVIHSDAMTR